MDDKGRADLQWPTLTVNSTVVDMFAYDMVGHIVKSTSILVKIGSQSTRNLDAGD